MQMSRTILFVSIPALVSCGFARSFSSAVQHNWGDTTRGNPKAGRYEKCENSGDVEQSDGHLRNLLLLLHRITESNPEVFTGPLSAAHICVEVDSQTQRAAAHSDPDKKRIVFTEQFLALAQSEGELAAVLSHELAHITLQHQGFGEIPPRVAQDPRFSELKVQADDIQRNIATLARSGADKSLIFALAHRFGALQEKMNRLIDFVYDEQNAHKNWFEQEADDVGSEFFIKAGFSQESFISMLWKFSQESQVDNHNCQKQIAAALAKQSYKRPERGTKAHPSICWRAFHLQVDEWDAAHAI